MCSHGDILGLEPVRLRDVQTENSCRYFVTPVFSFSTSGNMKHVEVRFKCFQRLGEVALSLTLTRVGFRVQVSVSCLLFIHLFTHSEAAHVTATLVKRRD